MITGLTIAIGVLANLISEKRLGKIQENRIDVEHATATVTSHFNIEYCGKKGKLMKYMEAIAALDEDAATQDPFKYFKSIFNNTFQAKDDWIYMYFRAADKPEALLESMGFEKDEIPKLLDMTRTSPETRQEYIRRFRAKLLVFYNSILFGLV